VVSVDCSSVVIDEMKRKYAHKAGMTFVKGDITHMEYQDGSFDVIVDKGTLDSVFCGDNAEENCEKVPLHSTFYICTSVCAYSFARV
jgi:hypothetical protein